MEFSSELPCWARTWRDQAEPAGPYGPADPHGEHHRPDAARSRAPSTSASARTTCTAAWPGSSPRVTPLRCPAWWTGTAASSTPAAACWSGSTRSTTSTWVSPPTSATSPPRGLLLNAGNYLKGYLGNRISQVNPMIDGGADGVSVTPTFTVEDVIPYYLYIETPMKIGGGGDAADGRQVRPPVHALHPEDGRRR